MLDLRHAPDDILGRAMNMTVSDAVKAGVGLTGHRTAELTEELYKPMYKIAIGGDPQRMCLGMVTKRKHLRSEVRPTQIGNHLAELSDKVFRFGVGVVIIFENDPLNVRLSLRSVTEVNVAEICMEFGGGGHPGAAGMLISRKDFRELWQKEQVVKSHHSDALINFG